MHLRQATIADADALFDLIQLTIHTCYPAWYGEDAVAFFSKHHNKEKIVQAICAHEVYLLEEDQQILATGSTEANSICRLFVHPQQQGQGLGSTLMDFFEELLFSSYPIIQLDASLPAENLYKKRGYRVVRTQEQASFSYQVMEKAKNTI